MTPRRQLMRSPRCTLVELVRESPAAIVLVAFIWGVVALLAEVIP